MLLVISPAKSLDYETPIRTRKYTEPLFLNDADELIARLRQLNPEELSELMNISTKLSTLNHERYANWQTPFTPGQARQALFVFKGDVYQGMQAEEFSPADVSFAQKHLRILSGLYGLLRPLDLMLPYRLEMGTRLDNSRGRDLYEFWGTKLTQWINNELNNHRSRVLVNLASNEYFDSLQPRGIDAEIVQPVFKDYSSGQYRVLSFFAKKARGLMVSWVVRNRIDRPDRLKEFTEQGYAYSEEDSTPDRLVFKRRER